MSYPTIGIFPAAGGLGGATLHTLLQICDPKQVVLISRHPEKLAKAAERGASTRKADFDDDASLEHAFEGVDVLNLISYPSFVVEHRVKVHKRAIDAARKQGVKTIIYSSLAFAGDCNTVSKASVMQAHLQTEAYLKSLHEQDPSFSYLIIRQGLYTESACTMYLSFLDPKNPPEEILIPHDGKGKGVAWVKREELGEATAKIIHHYTINPSDLNTTLLLSGPKALSLQETADKIGSIVGKSLPIRKVSIEEYAKQEAVVKALGEGNGQEWANAWEAIQDGETSVVTPTLQEWMGREPENFEVTMKALIR